MNKTEYEILKAKFLKLFATVPIPLREEIIAMVDDKPVSWDVAYGEIKNDTDNAKKIIMHLKTIKLL